MNLRAGFLSSVLSLFLILLGLIIVIVIGSLFATGLSVLPLFLSGSEIPKFSELANQAMETDHWMIVSELLRGIGALGLIALMVVRFDRRSFHFKDVGIAWRPNPIFMMLSGILVMSVIFFSAWGVAALLRAGVGGNGLSAALAQVEASGLIVLAISTLANAFWQELVFRGYLQPRFQRNFGILPGILIVSFLFVALHGLLEPVSIPEVITGTFLFSFVGCLYFVTNSIWLVTALHATANFYLILFTEVGLVLPLHLDRGLAYFVALLAAIVLFKRRVFPTLRAGTEKTLSTGDN